MNWFEEQLEYRRARDDENFRDSIEGIAGAVMGKRLTASLSAADIASSAIEEILKYYHCKVSHVERPSSISSVEDQLDYRLRPYGIMHRRVSLDKGWQHNAVGAMLGTLKEDGTAVALIPGKFGGYSYLNLKTSDRVRVTRKTAALLDEEAVCFYRPLPLKSLDMKDLLLFMIEQLSLSDIIVYVGLMMIATLLGLLTPMFTRWLFGSVLESGSLQVLLSLGVFMVCHTLCTICFSTFQTLMNERIGIKQNIAVQAAVMARLISLPPAFFKQYASGDLTQRAQYVQNLCSTLFNSILTTGLTSVFSLVYITQVFAYAPALVLPSIVVTLLSMAVSFVTTIMQISVNKKKMLVSSQNRGMVYAMLSGIQKIRLAGAEKRMFTRWANRYATEAQYEYNPPAFLKLSETISTAISLLGTIVMYYLAVKSKVSMANYTAFNAAYGMVSPAFSALISIALTIATIRPTLEMAKPILEAVPEISSGKEIITSLSGSIELNHVSFSYREDMPNVIDDLSLKIKAGEYVAIVGSTGCGKSTLLRLLLGFETPQRGNIYYDRKDLARIDLRSLRKKIGTVMQDGKLFAGDIYSNILIAAPHLTMSDAWEAAEAAAVADDIRSMPMGMHTMISEGQGGISGGQKQRLMIARAIAPKPKILMFDEATSALDNITQKNVSDAIDQMKCTRLVIAHRLSTIRHADRIIFLHEGTIVEDGTYEELIALNGHFARLVARQRIDIDAD